MSRYFHVELRWVVPALLVVIALVIALPRIADANGRVLELRTLRAGPYQVNVGTIPATPVLGALHMTMNVSDFETEEFIFNANVSVVGIGPEDETGVGTELGPIRAINSPTDPIFYDINTTVDRVGPWTFSILIKSDELGEGTVDMQLEVVKPSPVTGIVTLVTLVVFVAILGLAVRSFMKERGKRKQARQN